MADKLNITALKEAIEARKPPEDVTPLEDFETTLRRMLCADIDLKEMAPAMAEALVKAWEMADAVRHEREMVCQDFDLQMQATAAADTALAAFLECVEGGE